MIYRLLGPIILFFCWWFLSHFVVSSNLYIATPEETISSLFFLLASSQLYIDWYATILRVLMSFTISVIFGVPLAMLIGSIKRLFISLEIVIDFFRSLPSTALFPLFLLVFGVNDISRIGLAAFVAFWTVLLNTLYGVLHFPKYRVKAARAMKASSLQIYKDVIFWEILPFTFAGMRLALSISLILIIITEMIVSPQNGLGVKIYNLQQTYKIDALYALILITGLTGYVINRGFLMLERRIIHWTNY